MLHHTDKPRLTSSQFWAVLSQYSARFFLHKLTEKLQCGINRFKLFCVKNVPISSRSSRVKSRALFEPVSLQAKPLFHVDIPLNEAAKHWESYLNFLERKKEGEEADLIQQWQIKLAKNAEPPKLANTHIHTHTEFKGSCRGWSHKTGDSKERWCYNVWSRTLWATLSLCKPDNTLDPCFTAHLTL